MKTHFLYMITTASLLSGCATIHEMSAPKDQATTQTRHVKKQQQHHKLASQTSAWLGETVSIQSVDKGFFSTDFIAVTRQGKKISCFYGGYFGWKMSSIVCGGRGNPLLNAAGMR